MSAVSVSLILCSHGCIDACSDSCRFEFVACLRHEWSRYVRIHTEICWILSSCIPRHTRLHNGKGQSSRKILTTSILFRSIYVLNRIQIDTDKQIWACLRVWFVRQWFRHLAQRCQKAFTGNQTPLPISFPVNTRWSFCPFNFSSISRHYSMPLCRGCENGTACERVSLYFSPHSYKALPALCVCYLVSGEISSGNKIIPLLNASLSPSSLSMLRDRGVGRQKRTPA